MHRDLVLIGHETRQVDGEDSQGFHAVNGITFWWTERLKFQFTFSGVRFSWLPRIEKYRADNGVLGIWVFHFLFMHWSIVNRKLQTILGMQACGCPKCVWELAKLELSAQQVTAPVNGDENGKTSWTNRVKKNG